MSNRTHTHHQALNDLLFSVYNTENTYHLLIQQGRILLNKQLSLSSQTGSGKTFTITGGAERYSDRGIIPRTLSYLFQQYEKVSTSGSREYC